MHLAQSSFNSATARHPFHSSPSTTSTRSFTVHPRAEARRLAVSGGVLGEIPVSICSIRRRGRRSGLREGMRSKRPTFWQGTWGCRGLRGVARASIENGDDASNHESEAAPIVECASSHRQSPVSRGIRQTPSIRISTLRQWRGLGEILWIRISDCIPDWDERLERVTGRECSQPVWADDLASRTINLPVSPDQGHIKFISATPCVKGHILRRPR
jgi:hypothetical protein